MLIVMLRPNIPVEWGTSVSKIFRQMSWLGLEMLARPVGNYAETAISIAYQKAGH